MHDLRLFQVRVVAALVEGRVLERGAISAGSSAGSWSSIRAAVGVGSVRCCRGRRARASSAELSTCGPKVSVRPWATFPERGTDESERPVIDVVSDVRGYLVDGAGGGHGGDRGA